MLNIFIKEDQNYSKPIGYILSVFSKSKSIPISFVKNSELAQYHALKSFTEQHHTEGEVWVLFMVFPKEFDGTKFAWVELSEFDNAQDYSGWSDPAKVVSLTDRNDFWCDNP